MKVSVHIIWGTVAYDSHTHHDWTMLAQEKHSEKEYEYPPARTSGDRRPVVIPF